MVVLTHHQFRGADSPRNIFSTQSMWFNLLDFVSILHRWLLTDREFFADDTVRDIVSSNFQVVIYRRGRCTLPTGSSSATHDDGDIAAVSNNRLTLLPSQLHTELLINIFEALPPGSLASAARVCCSRAPAATTVLWRSPPKHVLRSMRVPVRHTMCRVYVMDVSIENSNTKRLLEMPMLRL